MSAKVISVLMFKGGVGKSQIAKGIVGAIDHEFEQEKKILIIDADPQASLMDTLFEDMEAEKEVAGLAQYLLGRVSHTDIVYELRPNISFVSSGGYDWFNAWDKSKEASQELFKSKVKELLSNYDFDFVVFDTGPGYLRLISEAIVSLSDELVLPFTDGKDGELSLRKTIHFLSKLNTSSQKVKLVPSRMNLQHIDAKAVHSLAKNLAKENGFKLINAIPQSKFVKEASRKQILLHEHKPYSPPGQAITTIAQFVM